MVAEIPALQGLLDVPDIRATATSIARTQEDSGAIPWFAGGHVDPWDHVECAMALVVGGEVEAAERAYRWLFRTQRADGSWPIRIRGGAVEDAGMDSNMCAYVAVGAWHHWLVRHDGAFLAEAWPVVRRALDLVTEMQLPFGGIAWARNEHGGTADTALVAGSSSIYHALSCGLALSELVDEPQPEWELAAGRLGHALREHEDLFEPKTRYSMDWYYPVLGGAVRGVDARRRLAGRWDDFVVPSLGIRCVDDNPWVTGAETCELALALDATGDPDRARALLDDMQHLRDPDGSYWTGYVYPDKARWPEECSTWTAAAVLLAVDALSRTTGGAEVFRRTNQLTELTEIGLECGCSGAGRSADRIPGLSAHAR